MKQTKIQTTLLSTITHSYKIYKPEEINDLVLSLGVIQTCKSNKKITYYNIPISFDIETTSFYAVQSTEQKEKCATMYIWSLCIGGLLMIGRTWEEFIYVYNFLVEWYGTYQDKRLIIYVHNLSFEFQFIKQWFKWEKVFALNTHKPVQAVTLDGIEFRCSYLLSGYNLAKLGEQLHTYKVEKMVGDLDYSLKRNSLTPLTDKELKYCLNDVLVVVAYIQELIEQWKYIYNIPLTKTGFVRNLSRNYCFYGGNEKRDNDVYHKYKKFIKELNIDSETYEQLKRAFAGGFTHANAWYVDTIVNNVHSFDETSAYPYAMLSEEFPMSAPEKVNIKSMEELEYNLQNYCCLFEIEIWDLESTVTFENYISESHCRKLQSAEINNGRVVAAKHLCMTIVEQDLLIIRKMYRWKKMKIYNFKRFQKDYLPTNFVKSILDMYEKKTTLKDVEGKEVEYLQSKENLNSLYGMCVTDICRDEIEYSNNEWSKNKPDIDEAIEKNNNSARRFLYYPWGVWVTAYARYNLFTAIMELGNDYVYSDTDSVKFVNIEKHIAYFKRYNKKVVKKLEYAMASHNISIERTRPVNIKGKPKQIGIWEYEGDTMPSYNRFKTLGAKRYMTEKNDKVSITVSGLNKKIAVPYLLKKYSENIFKEFTNELYIPAKFTGKSTHTYIDYIQEGELTDYLGNTAHFKELSSIHLEEADYNLSLAEVYVKFLLGIKESSVN